MPMPLGSESPLARIPYRLRIYPSYRAYTDLVIIYRVPKDIRKYEDRAQRAPRKIRPFMHVHGVLMQT